MYNINDINDLVIPDFIDNSVNEIPLITNGFPPPMESSSPKMFNHIKVENSLDTNVNFYVFYEFNNENFILKSGTFSKLISRSISIPKNIYSIYLTINILNDYTKENLIYHKLIALNNDLAFIISGTLSNPVVTLKE